MTQSTNRPNTGHEQDSVVTYTSMTKEITSETCLLTFLFIYGDKHTFFSLFQWKTSSFLVQLTVSGMAHLNYLSAVINIWLPLIYCISVPFCAVWHYTNNWFVGDCRKTAAVPFFYLFFSNWQTKTTGWKLHRAAATAPALSQEGLFCFLFTWGIHKPPLLTVYIKQLPTLIVILPVVWEIVQND